MLAHNGTLLVIGNLLCPERGPSIAECKGGNPRANAAELARRWNTQPKLLAACKAMLRASECHVFSPQPTDADSCRLCGQNLRNARHLRVEEGGVREAQLRASDEARAAIALAEPEAKP